MDRIAIYNQSKEVINRLVESSLSVREKYPSMQEDGGFFTIGNLKGTSYSIALKDNPYDEIYTALEEQECYHAKMIDGGLLSMCYQFKGDTGELRKHRLTYFPSPELPQYEECPLLYERDDLYLDIRQKKIVRFPIRFDFDPENHKDVVHPKSHLTFGQYENCRIPVSMPVSPRKFMLFVLRNFYHQAYTKHKNVFDKRMENVPPLPTLTEQEQRIGYFTL